MSRESVVVIVPTVPPQLNTRAAKALLNIVLGAIEHDAEDTPDEEAATEPPLL
jgi:hypothetical protein